MAIINNASAGSDINLLCLLYRVIFRNDGKFTREDIRELCAPPSLPTKADQQRRLPENFDFWTQEEHQLWEPDASGKIRLTRRAESDWPHAIAAVTNEALFAVPIDDIFAEKKKRHQTEELFQTIGCLLASDYFLPGSGRGITTSSLDEFYSQYLPGNIPNNSEKPIIQDYGHFLGYLTIDASGDCVVDPTRAVRRILPAIFGERRSLSIEEFLSAAARNIPVLDTGTYRQQVESRMSGPPSGSLSNRRLSMSLGLAMARLENEHVLKLDGASDDPNAWTHQIGGEEKVISTVRFTVDGGEA
jgi:hypothetical protein